MGNIVEKIGAMVARLGTKLANNYGGTASNRYVVLHAPAGSNNERLDPNCAMSLNEFSQVLGGLPLGLASNSVFENGSSGPTFTIRKGAHQAVFVCTTNGPTNIPTVVLLPRTDTSSIVTIHQGSYPVSNISLDSSTGDIIISRGSSHFWYWLLDMERI